MNITELVYQFHERGDQVGKCEKTGDIIVYYFEQSNWYIKISSSKIGTMETNKDTFSNMSEEYQQELLEIATQFALTPLKDRYANPRYYLRLPKEYSSGFSNKYNYLNQHEGKFFFSIETDALSFKTKFTQEEIDQLPNQEFVQTLVKEEVNEFIED